MVGGAEGAEGGEVGVGVRAELADKAEARAGDDLGAVGRGDEGVGGGGADGLVGVEVLRGVDAEGGGC